MIFYYNLEPIGLLFKFIHLWTVEHDMGILILVHIQYGIKVTTLCDITNHLKI